MIWLNDLSQFRIYKGVIYRIFTDRSIKNVISHNMDTHYKKMYKNNCEQHKRLMSLVDTRRMK